MKAPKLNRVAVAVGRTASVATKRALLDAKSTSVEAQHHRILSMLRVSPKSTLDFRKVGIIQTSTRIFELRNLGYNILTAARRDMFDTNGFRHERIAIYKLISEPRAGYPAGGSGKAAKRAPDAAQGVLL